nr:hypothetical protein [Endozoicomonas sp.]
ASATTSAGSAYAFPLGVEQWTNTLLVDLAPASLAYSPEGHILLAGLMIPHAVVNFILETFVASSLLIGAKELITCAVNAAKNPFSAQRLEESPANKPDLANRIKTNLNHFFTGRATKKVVNTLTAAGLLSVAAMALLNIVQYQLALSRDTHNIAAGYGKLANNNTLPDGLELDAANLKTIQRWAGFDADLNVFMIINTLLVQFYGATEGLRNAAGMVLGLPVRFINWCRGTEETDPSLIQNRIKELATFLEQRLDNDELESLLSQNVQTISGHISREKNIEYPLTSSATASNNSGKVTFTFQ